MSLPRSSRDVRVLQVVLSLDPGGTERLVVDLVTKLMADIPMAVCCLDEAGRWGEELAAQNTPVSVLGRRAGFRPQLGRGIAGAASSHRATVIHAHQYTPFVYSCFSRLWRRGTPIVFTEHGRLSDAKPSGKRAIANRVLGRMSGATFAVSEDLKRFMTAEGFSDNSIGVIYNGIGIGPVPSPDDRAGIRAELGVSTGDLVVGTVARLDPVKSLETFVKAVADITERRVTALIVGDGPERQRLESVADACGVKSRVRFLGQRDDARRWLAGCDAYVNCSTSEGVSLTILEAMAAALPVIVTRVGGTPEVVSDECSLLIPPRDSAALASAIRTVGSDPAAARAKGLAGRARVEQRFTIERMVQDYRAVYEKLANT